MKWIVLVIVALAVVVFFKYVKKKEIELEQGFQKRFAGKKVQFIDKTALYVARLSDGYSHFRGMGYLVLTDDELYFERQLDGKTFRIPITSITQVGEAKRLAGQNPGPLMLKVDYKSSDGIDDAIAWRVKELDRWKNKITALMKKNA